MDTKLKRRNGGVSHAKALLSDSGVLRAVPKQQTHADFVYNGGPVIRNPQVYTSFWGPRWSDSAHQARANRLNQFVQDLLNSDYMNVLSQYGVGMGAGNAGSFIKAVCLPNVPNHLDDSSIAQNIQGCIDAGTLPEPPAEGNNIVLIAYLDETLSVDQPGVHFCEPGGDFGYHFNFVTRGGNEFYCAVVSCLDDNCVRNACGSGICSLSLTQTQEERLTQVTSHEFAETCTDPRVTSGWFGTTSDEDGDICNGQPGTITVGANTWNVQRQYSKTDDEASNGATVCVIGAQSPMTKRTDGPA